MHPYNPTWHTLMTPCGENSLFSSDCSFSRAVPQRCQFNRKSQPSEVASSHTAVNTSRIEKQSLLGCFLLGKREDRDGLVRRASDVWDRSSETWLNSTEEFLIKRVAKTGHCLNVSFLQWFDVNKSFSIWQDTDARVGEQMRKLVSEKEELQRAKVIPHL